MAEGGYSVGDPVWAKLKGFSPWPGKIAVAPDHLKTPSKKKGYCVYFFGTENYAFIETQFIKPFIPHREKLTKANKSNQFKEALSVIDEYLRKRELGIEEDDSPPEGNGEEAAPDSPESGSKSDDELPAAGEKKPSKTAKTTGKPSKANSKAANKASNKTAPDRPGAENAKKRKPKEAKDKKPAVKRIASEATISPAPSPAKRSKETDDESDAFTSLINHSSAPSSTAGTKRVASLLDRPTLVMRPETPPLDVEQVSAALKQKNIQPSELRFGVLGLGVMGSGIVKNLLNSGHKVHVWNRSSDKCDDFVKAGAERGLTPSDVISAADVTFCCVSDPQVAKDIIFGNCGVLQEITTTKGYVEMTGIDAETSQDLADAIGAKGGRYMEAQVQGSKQQAEEGTLVLLAAGDRSLFDDCQSCFQAVGKNSFYLGEVGNASKMNLVLQLMTGVSMAGLAEGMALADRSGLQQKDVLEVLGLTTLACPLLLEKGRAIIEGGFQTQMALKHMQKDLKLSLTMSDQLEQPLPLTAAANEMFKHAKRVGYGDHDVSAVYIRARF
ncbi:putative oxidoreductase GLYR1 homolog [Amphibalanus amphitrite]|uniref:putative oxidoreductase GLYR1 homolog n=1 Tax=Amphibalanus amphitrite TaxID=1232801 RepID=UPI001C91FDE7|nr:putative oxidoreductase GLYR1 homolog [Amphibalanus amphitrite]